jgi:hypothetical protein
MARKSVGSNTGKKKGKPRGRPTPENLKPPWKPGESGNPAGRPRDTVKDAHIYWLKRPVFKKAARELAGEIGVDISDDGITNADALAIRTIASGIAGDIQAAKEVRQATEGDTVNANHTGSVGVQYVDDDREQLIRELKRRGIAVAFGAQPPDA